MIKEKIKENIGIIYLDRPGQLNALDDNAINRIREILKKFEEDVRVKTVLFDSLIEKDNNSNWPHKSIEEVPMDDVKKILDLENTYKENIY